MVRAEERSSFYGNLISKMILNINLRTWKSCMILHTDIFIYESESPVSGSAIRKFKKSREKTSKFFVS